MILQLLVQKLVWSQQNQFSCLKGQMSQVQQILGPQYFGTSKKISCIDEGDKSFPGPGTHDPNLLPQKKSPQWSLAPSINRNTFLDPHRIQYPSPQQYKVNYSLAEKSSTKISLPHTIHTFKPIESSIVLYKPTLSLSKTAYPEYSFGYSHQNDYSTFTPGPGAYQTLQEKVNISSHQHFNRTQNHFTKSMRPPPYGDQAKVPGPDKYSTIDFATVTHYSIGKGNRQRISRDPPARFYDIGPKKQPVKEMRIQPTKSRKNNISQESSQTPGPNAYHNLPKSKIYGGTIEKSKRKPIQMVQIIDYPSPDKYIDHKSIQTQIVTTFTKDKRHLSENPKKIPGPGTYQIQPSFSKIGGLITKKSKSQKQKLPLPGAGSYELRDEGTRKKIVSSITLNSNRVNFSKTTTDKIGPGHYNFTQRTQVQLGKLGKSERSPTISPQKTPGVGNYDLPYFIGRLPKYCTSPKKLTEKGFSTWHEKLKLRLRQKQKKAIVKMEEQSSNDNKEQIQNINPEQPSIIQPSQLN